MVHQEVIRKAILYTLYEKTEGAIKNEQPRDIGNFGYTIHRMKTNKTQTFNATQKTKRISLRTSLNTGVKPGALEGQPVTASYKTPALLLTYIVKWCCIMIDIDLHI